MSDLFGTDYNGRKAIPIFEGVLMYFPKAIAAVAEVSKAGNDQHNPGEALHWARGKSMDQYNTAIRHMMDHRMGGGRAPTVTKANNGWLPEHKDADGVRHLAKAAWRVLAALQLAIEEEEAEAKECGRADAPARVEPDGWCLIAQGVQRGPSHWTDNLIADQHGNIHVHCQCGGREFAVKRGDMPPTVVETGKTHSVVKCYV